MSYTVEYVSSSHGLTLVGLGSVCLVDKKWAMA